jgi:hypothetical protein
LNDFGFGSHDLTKFYYYDPTLRSHSLEPTVVVSYRHHDGLGYSAILLLFMVLTAFTLMVMRSAVDAVF